MVATRSVAITVTGGSEFHSNQLANSASASVGCRLHFIRHVLPSSEWKMPGTMSGGPDNSVWTHGPSGSPNNIAATADASTTRIIAILSYHPRCFTTRRADTRCTNVSIDFIDPRNGSWSGGRFKNGHQFALQRSMIAGRA